MVSLFPGRPVLPHCKARANTRAHVCLLQIVDFARTQKLAAFQAGDDQGDQLIIVQGPSNRTFATEEDLAEMQFVTRIMGEEASEVGDS